MAVSFGGCFCIVLKLLLVVMLQAIGETRFFSFLAAAGVVINTALVFLFVGVLHGGVAFSALATVVTNLLLAAGLFVHIRKNHPEALLLLSPPPVNSRRNLGGAHPERRGKDSVFCTGFPGQAGFTGGCQYLLH